MSSPCQGCCVQDGGQHGPGGGLQHHGQASQRDGAPRGEMQDTAVRGDIRSDDEMTVNDHDPSLGPDLAASLQRLC